MTSTLQQEGGRKLRLSAPQVMRVAQGLYERGYITYMRTDSMTLSHEALTAVRATVASDLRRPLPLASPRPYTSKVEERAGGPRGDPAGDALPLPDAGVRRAPRPGARLYELIWQRTMASQMADAAGSTVSVRLGARRPHDAHRVRVRGQRHDHHLPGLPPGVRRVARRREPTATPTGRPCCRALAVGAGRARRVARRPTATPPRRRPATPRPASSSGSRSWASAGPSTWASIIQTIHDRGYVWKKGQALVPTWTAFAVVRLLEQHFDELVDYEFTARMEDDLDAIARGDERQAALAAGVLVRRRSTRRA